MSGEGTVPELNLGGGFPVKAQRELVDQHLRTREGAEGERTDSTVGGAIIGGAGGGGGGFVGDHNDLEGRDDADCHPVSSITMDADIVPDTDGAYSIGDGVTPLRWANLFVGGPANVDRIVRDAVAYLDSNLAGVLSVTPARGLQGYLEFVATVPGVWTLSNVAAAYAALKIDAGGGAAVTVTDAAARFALLELVADGGSTITKTGLFLDMLWKKENGVFVLVSDIHHTGARRDNYCGEGPVTQNPPGVAADSWGTGAYAENLPDTAYACLAMGKCHQNIVTTDPLVPLVNVHVVCEAGLLPAWKVVGSATGAVHYAVTDSATNMGIDAVGYPTAVFDNYAALCAMVPIVPPNDTLAGAGLDSCDWIDRRFYV